MAHSFKSYTPSKKVRRLSALSCRFGKKNIEQKQEREKGVVGVLLAALRAPLRPEEYIYRRRSTFRREIASIERYIAPQK
jgi:hypothetical protein